MRHASFLFFVFSGLSLTGWRASGAQSQPIENAATQQCSVTGYVTNMFSSIAVKKANVWLHPIGDAETSQLANISTSGLGLSATNAQYSAVSQNDGTFCFLKVKPGRYTLSGSKSGFLDTSYGAKSNTESGKVVIVGPQPLEKLNLALIPHSVLSGKVMDEDNEQVNGASVKLLMRMWVGGRFRNVPVRGAQTNDLGEFRVSNIAPGTYYVVVQPSVANSTTETGSRRNLRTFHPGVTTASSATPMVFQPGEEKAGVNITLVAGQTHHVRGGVVGLSPTDRGTISLQPDDEEQIFIGAGGSNYKPNGTFDFANVNPGSYVLTYIQMSGETAKGARRFITVGDYDVNNIVLSLATPTTISGRIKIEGTSSEGSKPDLQKLQVMLTTADALIGPNAKATILADGSFVIRDIVPGRYLVKSQAPAGAYLKSIRYGQTNVTHQELDLTEGGAGEMEITHRYGLANVSGSIEQQGREVTSARVALIPTASDPGGRGVIFGNADTSNAFAIKNIPPGRYRAHALESINYAALQEPSVLKILQSSGTDLEIKEGDQKTISVQFISSEEQQQIISRARGQ